MYQEEAYNAFRADVADHLGTSPGRIVPGHGVQALIASLATALLRPGDHVVVPALTYYLYGQYCATRGATVHRVPMRELAIDLDASPRPRAGRALASSGSAIPNNPTGAVLDEAAWAAFLDALPDGCVAVVDEAYRDYRPARAAAAAGARRRGAGGRSSSCAASRSSSGSPGYASATRSSDESASAVPRARRGAVQRELRGARSRARVPRGRRRLGGAAPRGRRWTRRAHARPPGGRPRAAALRDELRPGADRRRRHGARGRARRARDPHPPRHRLRAPRVRADHRRPGAADGARRRPRCATCAPACAA